MKLDYQSLLLAFEAQIRGKRASRRNVTTRPLCLSPSTKMDDVAASPSTSETSRARWVAESKLCCTSPVSSLRDLATTLSVAESPSALGSGWEVTLHETVPSTCETHCLTPKSSLSDKTVTFSIGEPSRPSGSPSPVVTLPETTGTTQFPLRCQSDLSKETLSGWRSKVTGRSARPAAHAALTLTSFNFVQLGGGCRVRVGPLQAQIMCTEMYAPFKNALIELSLKPVYRSGEKCKRGVWDSPESWMPPSGRTAMKGKGRRSRSFMGSPGESLPKCRWFVSGDEAAFQFPARRGYASIMATVPELDLFLSSCTCCVIGFNLVVEQHLVRDLVVPDPHVQIHQLYLDLTTPAARVSGICDDASISSSNGAIQRRVKAFAEAPRRCGPTFEDLSKIGHMPIDLPGLFLCAKRGQSGELHVVMDDGYLLQATAEVKSGYLWKPKPALSGQVKA